MIRKTPAAIPSFLLAAAALLAALVLLPATASATHNDKNKIHPGNQTFTKGAQCTSNFIFRLDGRTFIGQAAHCSGTGSANETNGCDSGSLPLGTNVRVDGARKPGTMVYNSWLAMQKVKEKRNAPCQYNDFALIKLAKSDRQHVDPTVPFFGGPTGLGPSKSPNGAPVYSYGNSSARPGEPEPAKRKEGIVTGQNGRNWSRDVYTPNSPGIPGDSGSPFLNRRGKAIGTLSTIQIFPKVGSNGVSDMRKELAYARSHGFSGLNLVKGKKPFSPDGPGGAVATLGSSID